MNSKLILRICAAIFLLIGITSVTLAYYAQPSKNNLTKVETHKGPFLERLEQEKAYASSLSKEKTEFEIELLNLLSLTMGDKFQFGFGATRDLNWQKRRNSFTNEAWKDYVSFIERQREDLQRQYELANLKFPPKDGKPKEPNNLFYLFDFKPSSQQYTKIGENQVEFYAQGVRSLGYYDTRRYHNKFTIDVIINGNLKDNSKFVIQKWHVNVIEPGGFARNVSD